MRILFYHIERNKESSYDHVGRELTIGSGDDNDLILSSDMLIDQDFGERHLLIRDDGSNILVRNLDAQRGARLADKEMGLQKEWVWLAGQELRVGSYILYHNHKQTALDVSQTARLQRFDWIAWFFPLLLLLFTSLFGGWLAWKVMRAQSLVETPPTPTPVVAPSVTASPTATALVVITAPTVLAFTLPITPVRVDLPTAIVTPTLQNTTPVSNSLVTTATNQNNLAGSGANNGEDSGAAIAQATPVIITSTLGPPDTFRNGSQESQRVADLLQTLQIDFMPAVGEAGKPFWHLTQVIWLDEATAGGKHNIYVDVRKKKVTESQSHGDRIPYQKVIIAWTGGQCTPETVLNLPQSEWPRDGYGANCPMYEAGRAYSVWVDGYPSDRLVGLGLGDCDLQSKNCAQRETRILTSFLLLYELSILN